jgi:hypothetical protein
LLLCAVFVVDVRERSVDARSGADAILAVLEAVERRVRRFHDRRIREVDGKCRVPLVVVGPPFRLLDLVLGTPGVDVLVGPGDVLVPGPADLAPPLGEPRLVRRGITDFA